MALNLRKNMTFGFEQTFTIPNWWTEEAFISTSDTPKKREMMLAMANELAAELGGEVKESKDIWDHMQYEVSDKNKESTFYVTMDPGSIEVKTPPCLVADTQKMAEPMFRAADKAGLVAYRNWWYGVQGGTEGGCHVNMGGFEQETNPLFHSPELVVKYAAYVHNRPWLHHPFMGLDVGPQGNAMRMDEKEGFSEVKTAFEEYKKLYESGEYLDPQATYDHFEKTNLISEKSSYPSLYKFKKGLFLIEDRAQESLRSAEDFNLVSELRMQIFEKLQNDKEVESLGNFPNLHADDLTSFTLWENFKAWASKEAFSLEVDKYQRFFDRQFPNLIGGVNVPVQICLKDGRRPRKITDIKKRGDVIISKTVDTHFKRFEIYTNKVNGKLSVKAQGLEKVSEPKMMDDGISFLYLDIKYEEANPVIEIELTAKDKLIEVGKFNVHNMIWE